MDRERRLEGKGMSLASQGSRSRREGNDKLEAFRVDSGIPRCSQVRDGDRGDLPRSIARGAERFR